MFQIIIDDQWWWWRQRMVSSSSVLSAGQQLTRGARGVTSHSTAPENTRNFTGSFTSPSAAHTRSVPLFYHSTWIKPEPIGICLQMNIKYATKDSVNIQYDTEKQSSILKVVVNNCSVPGVQLTRAGEVSRGHQRPEAGRDDHIRDSSGHRTPSCHHPSVSGLLQTCYKQICVSSFVWLETIQLNISIFSTFLFQLSSQQISNIYGNFSLQKYIKWFISFLSCFCLLQIKIKLQNFLCPITNTSEYL